MWYFEPNNMKIKNKLIWNARRAGGLFLGIRVSFPATMWDIGVCCEGLVYDQWVINFGFIFFTWRICLLTNKRVDFKK